MASELTDADAWADLHEDEREWFYPERATTRPHGNCYHREREWLRRLAAARRESRDAAAVERDEIAAMAEREAERIEHASVRPRAARALRDFAARIRARKGAA